MEEEWCCVAPGFRFHPTEEELVGYYLARKVVGQQDDGIIQEVDLNSIEPWDLLQAQQHDQEYYCYFFSYKDRKYPSARGTGTRTNRATAAGFWKATGRDKPVLSSSRSSSSPAVIGMRKTLVFYRGRAPNGCKTDWIIHEYRLVAHHQQPDGSCWVVCRAFHKPTTTTLAASASPAQAASSTSSSRLLRRPIFISSSCCCCWWRRLALLPCLGHGVGGRGG
ncbi:hypothetical protein OsJ_16735 [Oryza sativa Japonica Group]|uniref:NAC domain-containing protein n=1 Tax=Oryza sativa subsp. japonica TaxID=39947 RepID=B9FDR2_ORYSJ|nr:hypothetical protein OsJ_16735 [Oryza sativa Japonica Group]